MRYAETFFKKKKKKEKKKEKKNDNPRGLSPYSVDDGDALSSYIRGAYFARSRFDLFINETRSASGGIAWIPAYSSDTTGDKRAAWITVTRR